MAISKDDILDALEVRENLEEFSTNLATVKITKEEIRDLIKLANDFEDAYLKEDLLEMINSDIGFHNIIANSTKNK